MGRSSSYSFVGRADEWDGRDWLSYVVGSLRAPSVPIKVLWLCEDRPVLVFVCRPLLCSAGICIRERVYLNHSQTKKLTVFP